MDLVVHGDVIGLKLTQFIESCAGVQGENWKPVLGRGSELCVTVFVGLEQCLQVTDVKFQVGAFFEPSGETEQLVEVIRDSTLRFCPPENRAGAFYPFLTVSRGSPVGRREHLRLELFDLVCRYHVDRLVADKLDQCAYVWPMIVLRRILAVFPVAALYLLRFVFRERLRDALPGGSRQSGQPPGAGPNGPLGRLSSEQNFGKSCGRFRFMRFRLDAELLYDAHVGKLGFYREGKEP